MTDPDGECPGGFCDGEGACAVSDGGVLLDAAVLPDAGPPPDAGAPDAAITIDRVGVLRRGWSRVSADGR